VQSAGKVMAAVFWDVYEVILLHFTPLYSNNKCSCVSGDSKVSFFRMSFCLILHLSVQTINAAAHQEALKSLQDVIRDKRPGLVINDFFFCTVLPQP
jgi:hypothetical protein